MRPIPRALWMAAVALLWATPTAAQLVPRGSTWKYLDDGSDQGTARVAPGFDDGGWANGAGQFGYGEGDETTVVSYGSDPNQKHITTYFRHSFPVTHATAMQQLTLRVLRDDGVSVFLNGFEVFRDNLPTGSNDFQTLASGQIRGNSEKAFLQVPLPPSLLVNGANVIAAEVHLVSGSSSVMGSGPLDHPAMVRGFADFGSVVLDVDARALTVSFLRDTGVVQDQFQLPASDPVAVAWSVAGGGPTTTPYGDVALTPPWFVLGPVTADSQGLVSIPVQVPSTTAGMSVWVQALRLLPGGGGLLSNALAEVIQ